MIIRNWKQFPATSEYLDLDFHYGQIALIVLFIEPRQRKFP